MKFTVLITLLFPLLLNAQINNPAPYCDIDYWGGHYNMFNTLDIDGTTHSFGAAGNGFNTTPYVYQNSLIFSDMEKGSVLTFTVDFHSIDDGEPQYFGIFIDYNQNNVFEPSELIMHSGNTIEAALPAFGQPAVSATLNVTIPSTALTGVTRMRIIRGEDLTPDEYEYDPDFQMVPCYSFEASYGCYYGFDVNITGTSTSISEGVKDEGLVVYPNPTNDYINVKEKISFIEIYSISGKKILSTDKTGKISLKKYGKGIYIIKTINNNGVTRLTRINLL